MISDGFVFKWYIIGDGPDKNKMIKHIKNEKLDDTLLMLGKLSNPFPYLKECSLFVLPSRYEGKPMSVTEAQILGLPVVVTNYESAREQVINGVDGIIIDNNDYSLYEGLKPILFNPSILIEYKMSLLKKEIDSSHEINKLYSLME